MATTETVLNSLIKNCLDAKERYRAAADHASLGNLRRFLAEMSFERERFAAELQRKVAGMGGKPSHFGSVTGTAERLAMDVNVDLAGDVVLTTWCNRDARKELEPYDKALMEDLPESCREILQRQTASIRASLLRLDKLRAVYEHAQQHP